MVQFRLRNCILCYAIVFPGRKSAFRAGFWPDCYRESPEIGPPAGRLSFWAVHSHEALWPRSRPGGELGRRGYPDSVDPGIMGGAGECIASRVAQRALEGAGGSRIHPGSGSNRIPLYRGLA